MQVDLHRLNLCFAMVDCILQKKKKKRERERERISALELKRKSLQKLIDNLFKELYTYLVISKLHFSYYLLNFYH